MIRAVHISRFRGIRDCVADGFGRVNLIIGRNDCGKTAFMEALMLAEGGEDAGRSLLSFQKERLGRGPKVHDLERFWSPIFYKLDPKQGLEISVMRDDHAWKKVAISLGAAPQEVFVDPGIRNSVIKGDGGDDLVLSSAWALDIHLTTYDQKPSRERIVATSAGLKLPAFSSANGAAWVATRASVDEHEVRFVSELKERGQDRDLVDLLRDVDERVSGIELLAPGGATAELFVRLDNGIPMLPAKLMGEGFQRCLSLGAAAAAHDWPTVFVDEIENGMHHLVLEPLWRWIAATSRRRDLQVFATTHSEECIQAAARAFHALDDDGLRVIRLDRVEQGTRATIYDRTLIETAERTGTEIRG